MDGSARLRVALLGEFRVARDDVVLAVPGARLRGLLVRLALAGGRAVEPGALVDAIWPEDPPSGPASALQTLVSRLRRALADTGAVAQAPGGYRLAVAEADVDALRFEQLAASGRERLRAGAVEAAHAVLAEAVALWGDRHGAEPPVVAAVAPAVATRLARISVEAVVDLADAALALGRPEAAEAGLAGVPAGHERAAAVLMDALAAQGRQAEALAVYERTRASLADDLGTDPGTALRERHLRLLRPVPRQPARSRLPAPLTSFVGREHDLARIADLFATGRLVTVLGPGGAGKTRLALEAGRRHEADHRDGAWFVDLASVTEQEKTAAAVLAAIGLRGGGVLAPRGRPGGDAPATLAGELGGREALLLLDNCEHVVDAAAHLVSALLPRCPGLRVLATSRAPLAVDGEALVPLGPLPLPGEEDDTEAPSVRLFAERAAAVRPGFALDATTRADVLRLVRGLDGLPLALELAAARLRTLSLPDLAAGLSDRFRLLGTGSRSASPRHRTLSAVIAWSWDLLTEPERVVAERIAVLPGGVTAASATAVRAGTTVPPADVPDLLAALVDRSLLQLVPGGYRMLDTIREYGAARLTDGRAVRDLAAAHVTDLVARHDPELRGPRQHAALEVIGAEYDNAVAALRHLCATGDSTGAVALVVHLAWYWQMSGRHADAGHWLAEVLAVPGGVPSAQRDCARAAHLLNRADPVSARTAQEAAADGREMRALAGRLLAHPELPGHHRVLGPVLLFLQQDASAPAVFADLAGGDGWLAGLAHLFLAEITENSGSCDETRGHVEAALTRFDRAGDRWGRAAVLPMRAHLRRYDDLDGAAADLREADALAAGFGPPHLGDQVLGDLRWADLHQRRGDTTTAAGLVRSAAERASHTSSADLRVLVAAAEADLLTGLGDLDRAGAVLGGARISSGDVSHRTRTSACTALAALCLARDDVPGARAALREAHAAALASQELPVLSTVAVTAAELACARGRDPEPAVLLGAAARLRGAHDRTDPRIADLARRGGAEFAPAYERGWALDPGAAAALVSTSL
ncbi:BTAD domain-containing putative transcriptional regulator [Lentzea sp.]|uniref:BTAD domain-containing putative transcriptional regulator n=1 Tax=Lentzea sp. TaxID=56099 RepID=UPI002ED63417